MYNDVANYVSLDSDGHVYSSDKRGLLMRKQTIMKRFQMVSSVRSVYCGGGGQLSFIVVIVCAVWLVLKELSKGPILSVQYVDKQWPALCVYMTPDSISDYFVAHIICTLMILCSTSLVQIRLGIILLSCFKICHMSSCNSLELCQRRGKWI